MPDARASVDKHKVEEGKREVERERCRLFVYQQKHIGCMQPKMSNSFAHASICICRAVLYAQRNNLHEKWVKIESSSTSTRRLPLNAIVCVCLWEKERSWMSRNGNSEAKWNKWCRRKMAKKSSNSFTNKNTGDTNAQQRLNELNWRESRVRNRREIKTKTKNNMQTIEIVIDRRFYHLYSQTVHNDYHPHFIQMKANKSEWK